MVRDTLFRTPASSALLVLRLFLALIVWPHGAQKMLGWFGGYGFSGTLNFLTDTVGLPGLIAGLVILIEFVGPLLLLVGLLVRPVALATAVLFVGIIVTSHLPNGFFMNWFGNQPGEGYEFHLLIVGMALSLLLGGAGRWSVDRQLAGAEASREPDSRRTERRPVPVPQLAE